MKGIQPVHINTYIPSVCEVLNVSFALLTMLKSSTSTGLVSMS